MMLPIVEKPGTSGPGIKILYSALCGGKARAPVVLDSLRILKRKWEKIGSAY